MLTSPVNLPALGRRQSLYVVFTTLQRPVFLLNSRLGQLFATSLGYSREGFHLLEAHLLPKLRCNFAEFLPEDSLTRLWILSSPTCVGLRYGLPKDSLRGFSWQRGIVELPLARRLEAPSVLGVNSSADLPTEPTYHFRPAHPSAGSTILLRHPFVKTPLRRYRIISLFSFDYAFRPHLRTRLTLGGRTFPRKP